MSELLYTLQNNSSGLAGIVRSLGQLELVWGFLIGLLLATTIHAVLLSPSPKWLFWMVAASPSASFTKIHNQDASGTYTASFYPFQKLVTHLKRVAAIGIMLICSLIALAVIQTTV